MIENYSVDGGLDDSLVVIWTTIESHDQGKILASELVKGGFAGCVQIEGPIESWYVWKGELQSQSEYRLAIKTRSELAEVVMIWLSENHPYEEPEILVTPVLKASRGYQNWVRGQTRPS